MIEAIAASGVLAIWLVVAVVNADRPRQLKRFDCDSVSPDGDLRCEEAMAHNGWCHSGDMEWRYESWAIGAEDYTRAAQPHYEPTTAIVARRRVIPRTVFWGGLALVFAVHLVNLDNHKPAPPQPKVQGCEHFWAWQCDRYK